MGYWGILDHESDDNLFLYPCPSGYCRCELRDMRGNTQCIYTFNSELGSDTSVAVIGKVVLNRMHINVLLDGVHVLCA